MSQDVSHRKPTDASRVQLSEGWEAAYWTRELGGSEEELQQIIHRVGPEVTAVRDVLTTYGATPDRPRSPR